MVRKKHDRPSIKQLRLNCLVQRMCSIDRRIATRSVVVLRLLLELKSNIMVRDVEVGAERGNEAPVGGPTSIRTMPSPHVRVLNVLNARCHPPLDCT